jgi:(p)ppGpp synthase/HD superfamily hydrolase
MKSFREFLVESPYAVFRYSKRAHAGQKRSDGRDYFEHPKEVARFLQKYKTSRDMDTLISAALAHDTIEDTETTHEDLEKMFGGLVASLVGELTTDKRQAKEIGKTEYLSKKMTDMSSWALAIKLADRLSNVQDIATAKTPEWRQKYRRETEKILSTIERDRDLTSSHKRLIQAIRDKLKEVE